MVSFVGGAITDADGRPLWRARCAATRRVIQHGAEGAGVPRWVSMERDEAELSRTAFELVARLRAALDGGAPVAARAGRAAVEALLVGTADGGGEGPMPYLRDRFVRETTVPVFMRLGVRIKTAGLRTGLLDALAVYAHRPCFAVCEGRPDVREQDLPHHDLPDMR